MATTIFDLDVTQTIQQMQAAALHSTKKTVQVGGQPKEIDYPFPSPGDWRDGWIYFLMIDRFNNPAAPPRSAWNVKYNFRQGGTFKGVQAKLDYIVSLGARAIWLSPVLKNPKPDTWEFNYHGYWTQDFLNIDERFGSDGTRSTAERELIQLIDEAHARGLYVILDIVINHAGRVFDYVLNGQTNADVNGLLNQEPLIQWINGFGYPRADWQDIIPPGTPLSADDAVWPSDFQRKDFFRRKGMSDLLGSQGYVVGDFAKARQLVDEYLAGPQHQTADWIRYGKTPVLSILIRCYQYLIAKYDVDGFRLDAVKSVDPEMVEIFGNAIREFALTVGKQNFFTFGEIAIGDEDTIARFVGRNSTNMDDYSYGIDAALDFPLFSALKDSIKGQKPVQDVRSIFEKRKNAEQKLLSTHGEAGRYFVTFIDNHDQTMRFFHPQTPIEQVRQALVMLNCLQGIPCLYYGTEQGLQGTVDNAGNPTLDDVQSVREALWGKPAPSFNSLHPIYLLIQNLANLRAREPALRYGRQYFRPVSTNPPSFGYSYGVGGIIAFSRILVDREVLVVANTSVNAQFIGFVVVDLNTNRQPHRMKVEYSNLGTIGTGQVQLMNAQFDDGSQGDTAALYVVLQPMEVQILIPA